MNLDLYTLILQANQNNFIGLIFFILSILCFFMRRHTIGVAIFFLSFISSGWVRYPTFGFLLNLDLIAPTLIIVSALFLNRFPIAFKRIFSISAFIVLIIHFTPIARIGISQMEQRIPIPKSLDKFEGFILLGGNFSLQQNRQSDSEQVPIIYNSAAPRLFEFVSLAQKYPDKKILFTGTPLEAKLTKRVFLDHGIDVKRLILESESRNTRDNAKNTYQIIGSSKEPWVLVTSAFHMPRSLGLFQKRKINVLPFPVDFHTRPESCKDPLIFMDRQNSIAWVTWVKSWAGMIDQFLMGLSSKLYPSL